jgi:chemotaxis protein CheX
MLLDDEIFQITQSIWASILDLAIEIDAGAGSRLSESRDRTLTGCVQLTGDWEGAVLLYCTKTLALTAASIMFETEPESLTVEEVQDALGELANMTAGNIKSLLPGASRLSLPAVVEGLDYSMIVPGSEVVRQVGFTSADQPLQVTLVRRKTEA